MSKVRTIQKPMKFCHWLTGYGSDSCQGRRNKRRRESYCFSICINEVFKRKCCFLPALAHACCLNMWKRCIYNIHHIFLMPVLWKGKNTWIAPLSFKECQECTWVNTVPQETSFWNAVWNGIDYASLYWLHPNSAVLSLENKTES